MITTKNAVNNKKYDLILASASPRRQALLEQVGITPTLIIPANIDEIPRPLELPRQLAHRLSSQKAAFIYQNHISQNQPAQNQPAQNQPAQNQPAQNQPAQNQTGCFILASDTVVAVGKRIIGKATTKAEARKFLSLLSGRRHTVYSGVSLITPPGKQVTRVVTTIVNFARLSVADIDAYLEHDEWLGKAGAYAIQGIAAAFIKGINGSYSNVVGLPLFETTNMLRGNGYVF